MKPEIQPSPWDMYVHGDMMGEVHTVHVHDAHLFKTPHKLILHPFFPVKEY